MIDKRWCGNCGVFELRGDSEFCYQCIGLHGLSELRKKVQAKKKTKADQGLLF